MPVSGHTHFALSIYLLVDSSGSARRGGFGAGCNASLPRLVRELEQQASDSIWLSLLTYDTIGTVRIALAPIAEVMLIPAVPAVGMSSLAAGLDTLARTIATDCLQLTADGLTYERPVVLIIADDLSVDTGEQILQGRRSLRQCLVSVHPGLPGDDLAAGPEVHIAMPDAVDALALAGLDATVHRIATGSAELVEQSLLYVVKAVLAGLSR